MMQRDSKRLVGHSRLLSGLVVVEPHREHRLHQGHSDRVGRNELRRGLRVHNDGPIRERGVSLS